MQSSYILNLKRVFLFFSLLSIPFFIYSQPKIAVGDTGVVVTDNGQDVPDASAVLDVSSANKGVLFPQMTTATRDLIPSPAEGLLIYNTTKKVYEFYNGTEWLEMGVVSGSGGSGGSFDTDAQLVFDRMPTLSSSEKTAINDFIVAEKAAGNYAKYDEFFLFPLGSTNGLIGFKSKTATAIGGVTWDINGATFDGNTGHIDSNINPSVDGVNYSLNDGNISGFLKDHISGDISSIWGVIEGGSPRSHISNVAGNESVVGAINSGQLSFSGGYEDNTMYSVSRKSSSILSFNKNGIEQSVSVSTSTLSSKDIYIGALNNNGTAQANYLNGTVSTIMIGGGIGFNHSAHNDNVRQLLTDLGLDLPSYDPDAQLVFNRMPTLSASEKTAINDFIVAEKAAGNYAKYDEFFLFPLGSTNGLIGFKSKTATAHGGVTWDINGATFDGVDDYIDSQWVPSTNGVNFKLNDAMAEAFIKSIGSKTNASIFEAGGASTGRFGFNRIANTSDLRVFTNSASTVYNSLVHKNNTLTCSARTDVNNTNVYENGTSLGIQADDSQSLPNSSFYIGATNFDNVPYSFLDGTLSSFLVGSSIGFNHSAHNTNVQQLLIDLGLTL